ncbi:hypothetical protein OK016_10540 [Vibrio chagasii]|nr:hypothetical protein [Vibrio chagasii]
MKVTVGMQKTGHSLPVLALPLFRHSLTRIHPLLALRISRTPIAQHLPFVGQRHSLRGTSVIGISFRVLNMTHQRDMKRIPDISVLLNSGMTG